jgi:hypothetical protein
MKFILILIIAIISAGASYGQLGKSEDTATVAYGKPLRSATPLGSTIKSVTYRTGTYNIVAGFKDGAAIYLIYKKKTGAAWTDEEIKSVLDTHDLGHKNWKWSKNLITGHHGPAVHKGPSKNIDEAQHWHIFAHDQYAAEYYPEKALLLIWDASAGIDAATILQQNLF